MLIYTLLPAIMLLLFGGQAALWLTLYHRPDELLERMTRRIGWITLAVYAFWLVLLTAEQRQIPILTAGQISIFLGFLIWMDQSLVERRVSQRMLVVLPLLTVVLLLMIGIAGGLRHTTAPDTLHSAWSAIHIFMSMAGIAMLLGSGVYGAGSLILRRELVGRKFGRLFSTLPSMDVMHKLRTVAVYHGWLLITVSFVTAVLFMFVENAGSPNSFRHLHEMFGLWIISSFLALSEKLQWLGDHKRARLAVAASVLFLLIIAGSVLQIYFGGQS